MNLPRSTDAVLGGFSPLPTTGLVLGGLTGIKHRASTHPEKEIDTLQGQKLLAQLMLYFYYEATPGDSSKRQGEYKSLYIESQQMRLHLQVPLFSNYPDTIKIITSSRQRAGYLQHQGELYGDLVKFVPCRLSADKFRIVAKTLLENAIAISEGDPINV